jgi:hypothetical protein
MLKTCLCVCSAFIAACCADAAGDDLVSRALALMNGAEEIVFAERNFSKAYQCYASFGEYADEPVKIYPEGGSRLCALNLRTGKVREILATAAGAIRDPRVSYDAEKILFAYCKGGDDVYHLYEIRVDGTGLKQLTFGNFDDVDPCYLPDGGIAFSSARCMRFIPCNRTQSSYIYRMEADGSRILPLGSNVLWEDHPIPMRDGRILYTRWEYTDRATESFRDLWVMNPDGSSQQLLWGGGTERPYPTFFAKCDAMPIPGTDDKVVCIFSPAFGRRESAGDVAIVNLKNGPDDLKSGRRISPFLPELGWDIGSGRGEVGFRDPFPLAEDCFLAAFNTSICLLDANGATQAVYTAGKVVHDPKPILPRPREKVIPWRIDLTKTTGHLVVSDVYNGRNMAGVTRGSVKEILIMEDLPKAFCRHGMRGYVNLNSTPTFRRVLGTVPVEEDGSASFELPAARGVYFALLDKDGIAVKRMLSLTMVMPGESASCAGCHEFRTQKIPQSAGLLATRRPPSHIKPYAGIPEILNYIRDVQPVWDRNCVKCHNSDQPSGKVNLSGDYNEFYSQSYYTLHARRQVSVPDGWAQEGNTPPYGFGTGASPLMKKLRGGAHHGANVTPREWDIVRLWVETSCQYMSTYAMYCPIENNVADINLKVQQGNGSLIPPQYVTYGKIIDPILQRRCCSCHKGLADFGPRATHEAPDDPYPDSFHGKRPYNMMNAWLHNYTLFNMSFPEKSSILRASMPKGNGGLGWCTDKTGKTVAVFADTNDPDYRVILAHINACKERRKNVGTTEQPIPVRYDRYVYWMKRFGILPEAFDLNKDPLDVYAIDQAYWQSFWYRPTDSMPANRLK